MEPDQVNTFSCAAFPSLPAQLDQEFCARRHRKAGAGDPCKGCDIGIQAAKTTAKDTRDGLSTDKRLRGDAAKRGIEIKKSEGHTEEAMAGKKLCSCGCGKLAVKDGLSTKCYRKKNGVLPFPKKGAPVKRQAGRQAGQQTFTGQEVAVHRRSRSRVRRVQGAAAAA